METMTIVFFQEIYKDRKKFSSAVFLVSSTDLINMGISIVSYTIKDISDGEVCLPLSYPFTSHNHHNMRFIVHLLH